ncbi:hypothetical protein DdX_17155 [Ditylenchus destructor]|uniref:Uncharacterized protein n=1 Tax=Ditylenchus destructor TaxID=166010 RepID=A0AAD4QZ87_9BILA|nr:hypothetical protein DdX_17155 [Ditylenchus destructor]
MTKFDLNCRPCGCRSHTISSFLLSFSFEEGDSHGAAKEKESSNDEIVQIMDSLIIPCRGVKRRRADSSPNQNPEMSRKKVDISGDTWLQILKFLTCPQWMQKCFVCRQINGVAQCNVSRLPMIVLDSAAMYRFFS